MQCEVLFAGFGGQGILISAKILARAAMQEGREVAWVPSYGPEMRGGTAPIARWLSATGSSVLPLSATPGICCPYATGGYADASDVRQVGIFQKDGYDPA